ncbi:S-layer homology domain-containing protein [Paenibacillus sp. strain BS8-2]
MRETSNSLSVQNSQQPKQFRGGEKKVMKKSLSLLVAIAMVFSMFASVAFAADELTAEQKYEALVEAGIFDGMDDGEAHLDDAMTRAQAAKIIALLTGYTEGTEVEDYGFKDLVGAGWATDYINYVAGLGIVDGMDGVNFAPSAEVTIEQLAKMVVEALDLEVDEEATVDGEVSDWAVAYVAAAVEAGLLAAQEDYTVSAIRELLVVSAYTAYEIISVPAELGLGTVAQTGAKKITVNFNRAATAEEQKATTVEVKNGVVPYTFTATWAEDGKSVVLTSTFLPAGEYDVTVKGFEAVKVTVAAEKVSKLEIGAAALQKGANQALGIKALNQFDEEVAGAISNSNVTVFNTKLGSPVGTPVNPTSDFKIDLSGVDVDSNTVVTVFHPATGLSLTKTYKIVAASGVTSIQLGAVTPLKDEVRIEVSKTGYVLPYTLVDQYGNNVKFTAQATVTNETYKTSRLIDGLNFVSSNGDIVDLQTVAVDADGVLTFNTGSTSGTVVLTVVNPATGATASVTVKVEAAAGLKTFTVQHPGVLVVAGEAVKVPYAAADTYGAAIAAKDVPAKAIALGDNFNITSSNPAVTVVDSFNSKGELSLTFTGSGSTTVFVWVNGAIASQFSADVKAAVTSVKVTGFKASAKTTLGVAGQADLGLGQLTVVDNYGRVLTALPAGFELVITETAENGNTSFDGEKVTGLVVGTEKYTVGIDKAVEGEFDGTAEAGTSVEKTYTVVAVSDIKSYAISDLGTIYGYGDLLNDMWNEVNNNQFYDFDEHPVTVTLIGKLANGTEVAIAQDTIITSITSSDIDVALVEGDVVMGGKKGTATITAWKGATKLAEAVVTVSDVRPVVTTVSFEEAVVTQTGNSYNAAGNLVAEDQYGAPMAWGTYSSSDEDVAMVNGNGTVTKVDNGEATITFVSVNGLVATFTIEFVEEEV